MSFVQIPTAYAADPSNVWAPKAFFDGSDPFAIVMRVQASSDLVRAGLSYDAVFQMANPRQDERYRWWIALGDHAYEQPTKDIHSDNQRFQYDNFAHWISWDKYSDAVREIRGLERNKGLFFVRAQIDVIGTNLFAHSGDFWYKAVP
ncbi:hypothetical protein [Arthrobacter sp. UYCo732]|uniref:hypothetical protein n=1 Tax=Arthrobacter sp. UYCo732 TaxID=3156336 RepID=UPI0033955BE4